MALSTATVWEIRTAGDDANGGGFVAGAAGTDYSQQDTKNTVGADISTTDGVANGTSTFTSATANFGTSIVGNIICLAGGTGTLTKGWYQVTARASTTSITLDRVVAAGTGITVNIGGALASLAMIGAVATTGNRIWMKAGTYTITSASTNISGGCVSFGVVLHIEGYQTVRGDMGTRPLFQADGVITAFTMIAHGQNGNQSITNIAFDGNGRTGSTAVSARGLLYNCTVTGCTTAGFVGGTADARAHRCSATGNSGVAFSAIASSQCVAYSNTNSGFSSTSVTRQYSHCLSVNNSGASSDGFASLSTPGAVDGPVSNCTAYSNGRHGFNFTGTRTGTLYNNIAEGNAGFGFTVGAGISLFACAGYNNGSGNVATLGVGSRSVGFVTGTGSFFTNAAGDDFTLNNTAGADVRGVGGPVMFGLTGYADLGVFQHQDGGGGGASVGVSHVFVG